MATMLPLPNGWEERRDSQASARSSSFAVLGCDCQAVRLPKIHHLFNFAVSLTPFLYPVASSVDGARAVQTLMS